MMFEPGLLTDEQALESDQSWIVKSGSLLTMKGHMQTLACAVTRKLAALRRISHVLNR